jgi:hypothetical protein
MNQSQLFSNEYFIAVGMAKMCHDDNDEIRVMDFVKANLNAEQIDEFSYEPDAFRLWGEISQYLYEKGIVVA